MRRRRARAGRRKSIAAETRARRTKYGVCVINTELITALPSKPLRGLISHYWLSLDNPDAVHPILPDAAVDLVIHQRGPRAQIWAYGTPTSSAVVALERHTHYLGVRFKPGQGRHFIGAAANELTDVCEPAGGLLLLSLDRVQEQAFGADVFTRLDALFENHVARRQPIPSRIDGVVAFIESTHGTARIAEAAALYGKSRRQFERAFLQTVGVSPKLFASIIRFQRAARLIRQRSASLAEIALASGFVDQSHMNHAFTRLAGMSPVTYAGSHVAFLQDREQRSSDNGRS